MRVKLASSLVEYAQAATKSVADKLVKPWNKNTSTQPSAPSMPVAFFLAGHLLMGVGLGTSFAHHGWRWTKDGQIELTAVIEKAERIIIGGKNFDLYPERLPDGKK